jgi:hypothetical protein
MRWEPLDDGALVIAARAALVQPGGETTLLELPPGLPLGLAAESFHATRISPTATLGTACHTITQALRQHGEDDITLLLARIRHGSSR